MCSPSPLLWGCVRPDNDSYSARLVEQSRKSKTVMEQEEWDRLFFREDRNIQKQPESSLQVSECPVQAEVVLWLSFGSILI